MEISARQERGLGEASSLFLAESKVVNRVFIEPVRESGREMAGYVIAQVDGPPLQLVEDGRELDDGGQ